MRYIILFVFLLVIVAGMYFTPRATPPNGTVTPVKKVGVGGIVVSADQVDADSGTVIPAAIELPGAKRPEEPHTLDGDLEGLIRPENGFQRVNVSNALLVLEKLDPDKLTKGEIEALRWSLFEPKANDTIRNNTANVLLKAKDELLAGALIAQLQDQKQNPTWRNYCVQHLETCYRNLKQAPQILDAILQATTDPEEDVRDVCLLHLSRMAVRYDWKSKDPKWFERTESLVEKYLEESDRTEIERVSGIVAAGHMGLVEKVKKLTTLLSDSKSSLGIRKSVALVLGNWVTQKKLTGDDLKLALAALAVAGKDRNPLLRSSVKGPLAVAGKDATKESPAKSNK